MDLIHKIESLRYDIENGVVTDVISISVRLIQIKDQALQLQQTGVMARCNIDLVGKELEYISPITKAKTKFKVADVFVNIFNVGLKERMVYGEVFAISENGNKYKIDEFSEVRIPQ